jgi:hypothetical protein
MAAFLNGLSKQYEVGIPPSDWHQASDGFWYPSSVSIETPTSDLFPDGVQDIVQIVGTDIPIILAINVLPATPVFGSATTTVDVTVTIQPITVPLSDAIKATFRTMLTGKIENYFDEDRAGKTLLNFGDDYQSIITNWKYASSDKTTIAVKLYAPLPGEIEPHTPLWISRELTPSVLDRIFFQFVPQNAGNVFLRPPNRNLTLTGRTGTFLEGATLRTLFSTGSLNVVKVTDPVLEEWYTHDFNNSTLNIDFSDYRNFVFFGSAKSRLDAFVQKLKNIEAIDVALTRNSASLAGTGSAFITGTLAYPAIQKFSDERIETLRSFDPYERFLYYETGIAYSSSLHLTDDEQDAFYYHADATWPKISGSVVPVASASVWYTAQAAIADDYDRQNQDYLVNNTPQYLQADADSSEFRQFLNLVGHQMDTLKVYIDHMPNIYDRNSDPDVGLHADVVWNVAQSFGIDLPNQYAIKNLVDYTIDVLRVYQTRCITT